MLSLEKITIQNKSKYIHACLYIYLLITTKLNSYAMILLRIEVPPEVIEIIQLIGSFILGWITRRLTPKNKTKV